MLLQNKVAIVYGAGGSLGGSIARAFSKEGALVYLAGRTQAPLSRVANEIIDGGGKAETAVVDPLDCEAVTSLAASIIEKAGRIDISFSAIGVDAVQGVPLYEIPVEHFMTPILIGMQSQLLTAAAAAKHMIKQGAGVILSLSATAGGMAYPLTGGFGVLCNSIEAFSRNLAVELGPKGIRVVNMRSGGSPDARVFVEAMEKDPAGFQKRIAAMVGDTMLKRLPRMQEIANAAVFLVSDLASGMTGTSVNITCGTAPD